MMDWSKATPEMVREILDRGETYLQAQLTVATSADQRAAAMASIFAASGAAISAGLIAAVTAGVDDPSKSLIPVLVGGITAAVLFLIGAVLCTLALMPTGFFFPGTQPSMWEFDLAAGKELKAALTELAENYQTKIDDNRKTIDKNASKFKWGARAGIVAPFVGLVLWGATSFCHS